MTVSLAGLVNVETAPHAAAATIPTVDCSTDTSFVNTGYNGSSIIANGSDDDNWEVSYGSDPETGYNSPGGTGNTTSLPPDDASWHASQVGKVANAWTDSPYQNANWISAKYVDPSNGINQPGNENTYADFYYRYQFNLDSRVDPSVVTLAANWYADNGVAAVWVNGVKKASPNNSYDSTNYNSGNGVHTDLNSGWKSGLNTIIAEVKSSQPAEGFDAQVGPGALCDTGYQVSKTVTGADSDGNALPGTKLTYDVAVKNTGGQDYTDDDPASFTDDLSKVTDDATYNGDATNGATVDGETLSWKGALAHGETTHITYSVTVNTPDKGDKRLDNAVTPGSGGKCVDGACKTSTPVNSYTVSKKADKTSVKAGDTVKYTVTVKNTGAGDYTDDAPATFTDDLAGVLDDATYNNDASNGATVKDDKLSWSGAVKSGESVDVTYSVKVNNPDTGDKDIDNAVTPDQSKGGSCAGADDCSTSAPLKAYTVTKKADKSTVTAGSTLTYTVTVANTGNYSYTAEDPASFTDDLSKVTDDATYNKDASAGATVTDNTLSWKGALPKGESRTITYSVTVNSPDKGDKKLNNAVVPGDNGGSCAENSCSTSTPLESYTVAKKASTSLAQPGSTITYTVTLTNTGAYSYTAEDPASFTDDLSKVTDDATYNGDATNGATVTDNTLSWKGALPKGESRTITYSVTVNSPDNGDSKLTNAVVPTAPGGGCAGQTDCTTTTPVQSYTVTKRASTSSAKAGQTVTYTVTVTNTGAADYTEAAPASFTDDLSKVTDDATYNGDATNGAAVTDDTLTWSGALAQGQSIQITYSVTVDNPDQGDHRIDNAVTATGPGGGCAAEGACTTRTDVPPVQPAVQTGGTTTGDSRTTGWLGLAAAGLLALMGISVYGLKRRRG